MRSLEIFHSKVFLRNSYIFMFYDFYDFINFQLLINNFADVYNCIGRKMRFIFPRLFHIEIVKQYSYSWREIPANEGNSQIVYRCEQFGGQMFYFYFHLIETHPTFFLKLILNYQKRPSRLVSEQLLACMSRDLGTISKCVLVRLYKRASSFIDAMSRA